MKKIESLKKLIFQKRGIKKLIYFLERQIVSKFMELNFGPQNIGYLKFFKGSS